MNKEKQIADSLTQNGTSCEKLEMSDAFVYN